MKAQNDSGCVHEKLIDENPVGFNRLNFSNCKTLAETQNSIGNAAQLKYLLEKQGNHSVITDIAVYAPGKRDLPTDPFFAERSAVQHVPKRAEKAVAVKKKRSNKHAPGGTMSFNLDMPGFQRLDSVLAIFPVSRAAYAYRCLKRLTQKPLNT